MEVIHLAAAWIATVAVVVGLIWSLVATRVQALRTPRLQRLQSIVLAILATTAIAGLAELASGAQPKEGLHFLYAAIAIAVIPLTRSFVPADDRRSTVAATAALVVLGFVIYRLFATG